MVLVRFLYFMSVFCSISANNFMAVEQKCESSATFVRKVIDELTLKNYSSFDVILIKLKMDERSTRVNEVFESVRNAIPDEKVLLVPQLDVAVEVSTKSSLIVIVSDVIGVVSSKNTNRVFNFTFFLFFNRSIWLKVV